MDGMGWWGFKRGGLGDRDRSDDSRNINLISRTKLCRLRQHSALEDGW